MDCIAGRMTGADVVAGRKPVFSGLDRSVTFSENAVNAAWLPIDANVTVANPDGTGFGGGALRVSLSGATNFDTLSVASVGGITVVNPAAGGLLRPIVLDVYYDGELIGFIDLMSHDVGAVSISLTDAADDAAVTALTRAISYQYGGDAPSRTARTLTYALSDAEGATTTARVQLKIAPENDAPQIYGLDGASFVALDAAKAGFVVDGDVSVTNPDGTGFKGGSLGVHLADAAAGDQLYLAPGPFSVKGTQLYLNGRAVGAVTSDGAFGHDLAFTFKKTTAVSDAQMSALMEQVGYRSTAQDPAAGMREVTFTVVDAEKDSAGEATALGIGVVNHAPVFTSPQEVSFPENGTGIVQMVTATDPDGDEVTFALVAGEGSSLYIGPDGDLRFETPPDFEHPLDSNADNVYVVTVQASDRKTASYQIVNVVVTDVAEGSAALEPAAAGGISSFAAGGGAAAAASPAEVAAALRGEAGDLGALFAALDGLPADPGAAPHLAEAAWSALLAHAPETPGAAFGTAWAGLGGGSEAAVLADAAQTAFDHLLATLRHGADAAHILP